MLRRIAPLMVLAGILALAPLANARGIHTTPGPELGFHSASYSFYDMAGLGGTQLLLQLSLSQLDGQAPDQIGTTGD